MLNCIAIRKETKDKTQQRAPLSPKHVRELVRKHKLKVIVEPWEQRIFKDHEYTKAGAILSADLWDANIIFGVKDLRLMLNAYLLEKAIYEVGCELDNRPDWLTIPLHGIQHLMKGA